MSSDGFRVDRAAGRDDIKKANDSRRPARPLKFYTIAEIAELLGVSIRTVHRWIADGRLVAHRFGGAVRISEADVEVFLALHRHG